MSAAAIAVALDSLLAASLVAVAALSWQRSRLPYVALALASAGSVALVWGIAERGRAAGQWPLINRFEFALWLALALLAVLGVLLMLRYPPSLAAVLLPAAAITLASGALLTGASERSWQPAPPVLRSLWLPVHGLAAAVGYAAMVSAGALAIALLLRQRWKGVEGEAAPTARAMEVCAEIGFPALSLAMVAGMIWSQRAWGEYWSGSPKECWALVAWLCCLAFLHARRLPEWRPRLPWLAIAGLAAVAFALYGVPSLLRFTAVSAGQALGGP